MASKFNPTYHTAFVSNWRFIAKIPVDIPDYMIYDVVTNNDLQYRSSQTDEENQENIKELRYNLPIKEKMPVLNKKANIVNNWRFLANLSTDISDDLIYQIVTDNDLGYASDRPIEENFTNIGRLKELLEKVD